MELRYSTDAQNDLRRLERNVRLRIEKKIQWFVSQEDPLHFAMPLQSSRGELHRFRIGNYRAVFIVERDVVCVLLVLAVKHRKDAYRTL